LSELPPQPKPGCPWRLNRQRYAFCERGTGKIGFQSVLVHVEKIEDIKTKRNLAALYTESPRDTQIQGGIELGSKGAKVSSRGCSHEERTLLESVDKQQPAKHQSVIISRHNSQLHTICRIVIGTQLSQKAAIKIGSASCKQERIGIGIRSGKNRLV